MKINFKHLSTNLSYQEMAINDMYTQKKINDYEYEELQKCLNGLYRFNKNMMRVHGGDSYISEDHIDTGLGL